MLGVKRLNQKLYHYLIFTDSGCWKSAKNIKVGDKILTTVGELKEVTVTRIVGLECYCQ
ncbi:hypothetical protein ABCY62_00900 [Acetivibrio clariflavus]|uniref:hypothetical protein n=1 Tax=Acetivibrio clariflavus TaxID=288965 RepID=UPI0031F48043